MGDKKLETGNKVAGKKLGAMNKLSEKYKRGLHKLSAYLRENKSVFHLMLLFAGAVVPTIYIAFQNQTKYFVFIISMILLLAIKLSGKSRLRTYSVATFFLLIGMYGVTLWAHNMTYDQQSLLLQVSAVLTYIIMFLASAVLVAKFIWKKPARLSIGTANLFILMFSVFLVSNQLNEGLQVMGTVSPEMMEALSSMDKINFGVVLVPFVPIVQLLLQLTIIHRGDKAV